MKELLEMRTRVKLRKPSFLKQDAHKKKKLKNDWRKPRGRHSKMRLRYRGYRKSPSTGYSSPKRVRGLNKEGLIELIINKVKDLEKVKDEILIISGSVGIKKKIQILEEAKKRNLRIGNIKNFEEVIKKVQDKKKEKVKKKKLKEEKKKEEVKEEKVEEKKDVEERKKEEEKIKKKVLERKTKGRE